jgi:hypothetical protein
MLLERRTFKRPVKIGFAPPEVEQTLFRVNETRINRSNRGLCTRMMNRLMICAGYPATSKTKGYATLSGGAMITMILTVC